MRRFLVGFIAVVIVVSFIIGAGVALSSGGTSTATATSTMIAGPVNGHLLPSGNGGARPLSEPSALRRGGLQRTVTSGTVWPSNTRRSRGLHERTDSISHGRHPARLDAVRAIVVPPACSAGRHGSKLRVGAAGVTLANAAPTPTPRALTGFSIAVETGSRRLSSRADVFGISGGLDARPYTPRLEAVGTRVHPLAVGGWLRNWLGKRIRDPGAERATHDFVGRDVALYRPPPASPRRPGGRCRGAWHGVDLAAGDSEWNSASNRSRRCVGPSRGCLSRRATRDQKRP